MAKNDSIDWNIVLNTREFWLDYFNLSDERIFCKSNKLQQQACIAFRELLSKRELILPVNHEHSLVFQFDRFRDSIFLASAGKRKRLLLGWIDPLPYNKLFRYSEIKAITSSSESELAPQLVFLMLLAFWGISEEDKPHAAAINKEVAQRLRQTKLFSREETSFISQWVLKNLERPADCEWIEHKRWGWIAQCPSSLRVLDKSDLPDGITFDIKRFNRFLDSVT